MPATAGLSPAMWIALLWAVPGRLGGQTFGASPPARTLAALVGRGCLDAMHEITDAGLALYIAHALAALTEGQALILGQQLPADATCIPHDADAKAPPTLAWTDAQHQLISLGCVERFRPGARDESLILYRRAPLGDHVLARYREQHPEFPYGNEVPLPIPPRTPALAPGAIPPDSLGAMRHRGGRWAAYRNEDTSHHDYGRTVFLQFGPGCTFTEPPPVSPERHDIGTSGWRYRLAGSVDLDKGEVCK